MHNKFLLERHALRRGKARSVQRITIQAEPKGSE